MNKRYAYMKGSLIMHPPVHYRDLPDIKDTDLVLVEVDETNRPSDSTYDNSLYNIYEKKYHYDQSKNKIVIEYELQPKYNQESIPASLRESCKYCVSELLTAHDKNHNVVLQAMAKGKLVKSTEI